jgi:hypothetical protein
LPDTPPLTIKFPVIVDSVSDFGIPAMKSTTVVTILLIAKIYYNSYDITDRLLQYLKSGSYTAVYQIEEKPMKFICLLADRKSTVYKTSEQAWMLLQEYLWMCRR